MRTLELNPDRFFDPGPEVRRIARELFDSVEKLPLVCPHGHVPVELLAQNEPFPEPTSLILIPDHYIYRMLHSQGVPLEQMGVPTRDGTPVETDHRLIWRRFAEHYYLFLGTPTRAWLDYVLYNAFEIRTALDGSTADLVYDQIHERLQEPDFRPRALYDRFRIEVLTTTDAACDTLAQHQSIVHSSWDGRVVPCFRPDSLFKIADDSWPGEIERLANLTGSDTSQFSGFVSALEERRVFFKSMGATSTDHAVVTPRTHRLSKAEIETIYDRALGGEAHCEDQYSFEAHMLMEMARMSCEDGLVMQIHPGSYRDHDQAVHARFGQNVGADIPVATEYTRNLLELLNAYGSHPNLTIVLFTLDESTYARELAPLAGHYPAVRLGPPWWFHDSIEGMKRYRARTTETAGVYNTVGFNDDTRAFLSIPARHDLSRRVDANYVAGLVARHQIDMADGFAMVRAFAYDLVKQTYRL
jgi:glucuronate isomerase